MKALLLLALIVGACLADDDYEKWSKQDSTVYDKDGMSQEIDGNTKNGTFRHGSNAATGHLPIEIDTNEEILKIPAKMSEDVSSTVASTTVIQDTVSYDSRMDRKPDAAVLNTSKTSRMEKTMLKHREARFFGKSPTKQGAAERSKSESEGTGEVRHDEKGQSRSSEATGAVGPRISTSSKDSEGKRDEDAIEPEPRSDASATRQSGAFKESESKPIVVSLAENMSNEPSAALASTNRSSTESATVKSLEPRTTNGAMRTSAPASVGSPEKAAKPILSSDPEQSIAMTEESLMAKRAAADEAKLCHIGSGNDTEEAISCGFEYTMRVLSENNLQCVKNVDLLNVQTIEAPFRATFYNITVVNSDKVVVQCFCDGPMCNEQDVAESCIRKSIESGHYNETTVKQKLVDEAVRCITGSHIKDITTTTSTTTTTTPPSSTTTTTPPKAAPIYRLRVNDEDEQAKFILFVVAACMICLLVVVGLIIVVWKCVRRNKKKNKNKTKKEPKKEPKEPQRPVTPAKTPTTVSPVESEVKRVRIGSQLYQAKGRLDVAKMYATADLTGPHSEEGKPSVDIKAITFDEAANEVHDISDRKPE